MKTSEDIVNESGYPLQLRIERWIEETGQQHRWWVAAREHRWVNSETGDEGYIDVQGDEQIIKKCAHRLVRRIGH